MRRFPQHYLAGCLFAGMLLMAVDTWSQPSEGVGRITALEGQATVLRQGRFVAEPLTLQTAIFQEDIIETGAASRVKLTLIDTTVISLGENSRLELSQFLYHARQQTRTARFGIPRGFFRAIVNKLLPQSSFDVITPTAVAAIRGTDLMGEVTAGATMIVVLDGTVVVSNVRQNFRALATLTPGAGTTVTNDQPPTTPTHWSEARIEALRRATNIQ